MTTKPDSATLQRLYWDKGLKLREIAAMFGVWPASVGRWLKAAGIPRRYASVPEAVKDEICILYAQGLSLAAVRAELAENGNHIPRSTMWEVLQGRGVRLRPRGSAWMRPRCADCGRPAGRAMRCLFHRRLRRARQAQDYRNRGVPAEHGRG